ncbi:hypothetical protein O159_15370 [Leifsonia xyli subsp. cynodontis DSM 46306]|uniref:Antitoxin protein n=1 Tax=Leifsonia xyli subsp. cynodontis DSM 46306 TaxID=1389489 RepID=U3PDG9_LEIXC|nr:antitoxin [Leifsonia xyli]AGW41588.1 hypothetical protein O159_15370 [Leifsonia xyli subsp. cynodontis DSM 46306]
MSAFDDITKKAQDLLNGDKVKDALTSEQAEGISDKILDGVADAANTITGGTFGEQIDGARDAIDKKLGNE